MFDFSARKSIATAVAGKLRKKRNKGGEKAITTLFYRYEKKRIREDRKERQRERESEGAEKTKSENKKESERERGGDRKRGEMRRRRGKPGGEKLQSPWPLILHKFCEPGELFIKAELLVQTRVSLKGMKVLTCRNSMPKDMSISVLNSGVYT